MKKYFCGWYFKCQSDTQMLAAIPAIHRSEKGRSCSIQLITNDKAWNVQLPYSLFHREKPGLHLMMEKNYFGEEGMELRLSTPELTATGSLRFGSFTPVRYDVMGPFRYVPFMECRHSVLSMKHTVNGEITVNGTTYHFHDDMGYLEGDRGRSFPKKYAWTQCWFTDGALMLSVADIPLGALHFTGVIGILRWHGREYRLATYLGAKAVRIRKGELVIRQGDMRLTAKLIEKRAHPLSAPANGSMTRTIHESPACHAAYRLERNGHPLIDFETQNASFEYEYPF